MNPYEEKLAQFLDDEVMYSAVKSILEAEFDLNVQIKEDYSEVQIYELVSACRRGRERLTAGFKEMEKYRIGPLYTPNGLRGTLQRPSNGGGANWGGAAWDAEVRGHGDRRRVSSRLPFSGSRDSSLREAASVQRRLP